MTRSSGAGRSDGRNIDPALGALGGEGAGQAAGRDATEDLVPHEVYASTPAQPGDPEQATYYDRPTIKEPVWIWAVPAYFFAGGAAGGAGALAAACRLAGPRGERLVRRASWLAFGGAGIGAVLLVVDLGRPERFANMLRVFRPSSPMSVGSWVLAAATPCFGASALLAGRGGHRDRVAALAVYGGGLLALPLSGYTAVLLSTTAVPVWQKTSRTLPYLFVASAASSAASLLGMANLDDHEAKIVTRFGTVAALAELVAGNAVERDASEVERVGRPLREGLAGSLWKASTRLSLASLAIAALPGRGRAQRIVSGLLGAGAGLCLRFSIFHAGKVSARDPRATFAHQHHGFGGVEVTGRPAVRAPAGADP